MFIFSLCQFEREKKTKEHLRADSHRGFSKTAEKPGGKKGMYKDQNILSGSGASTKGDEVEIVSRFLAPLCDRDEAARNIALAAARTTVEGWLGGVSEPNQWEEAAEMENSRDEQTGKFKGQNGRYDMSIERSPTRTVPKTVHNQYYYNNRSYSTNHGQNFVTNFPDTFRIEGFFPQSVTDNPPFPRDSTLDSTERYPSCSFDCVDGRLDGENLPFGTPKDRWQRHRVETVVEKLANTISSDEARGLRIENRGKRFNKENETRFSSSSESERKLLDCSSSEKLNELPTSCQEEAKLRIGRIKGGRQKQLEDDDLDSDTRIYGKSPKFDENMGNFGHFETNYRNYLSSSESGRVPIDRELRGRLFEFDDTLLDDDQPRTSKNRDGVVFNTLDGFDHDYMIGAHDEDLENMNLESMNPADDETIDRPRSLESSQDQYLRNNNDRKFSAGQIKRPLSQDEDVSSKSGRVLEGPEVTPGDVGRLLNLGNALDEQPQQDQPNKYLSLVTLHLPVILRLSVNCPFHNVRIKCAEILQMVKDRGLPVPEPAFDGPSAFLPASEMRI